MDIIILGLNFLCFLPLAELESSIEDPITDATIQDWIDRLGSELWVFADLVTRRKQVQEHFREAKVEVKDGSKLADEIAKELSIMMDSKMKAIERIMDVAESAAEEANNSDEKVPENYKYYNAKLLVPPGTLEKKDLLPQNFIEVDSDKEPPPPDYRMEMLLKPNKRFSGMEVNTTYSAVHVPTNIYDRSENVLPAIKWSQRLEPTFRANYESDPSMSWQYFGSSTGFMRHYPAKEWKMDPVDLYDCRTRSWYVEAATSPKDVLILVDNSGSMTGERKQIARHVVNNILDTLGNNDFVNILSFIADTEEVVPCFKDRLVQANLANVRQLKIGMEEMGVAKNIANFKVALVNAFKILETHAKEKVGSLCNQAIMLITDGVPDNYKDIFEKYNWQDRPRMPVRVFTYLIGREASEIREVKWMACANRGYYVHLSTTAEVQEQVLQYVPVMARPMVLQRDEHPIIWTPVYADITDPRMTDWLWEQNERMIQRERSLLYKQNKDREHDLDKRYVVVHKKVKEHAPSEIHKYRLMTSVSIPVYDRRDKANVTEQVLVNEAYWVLKTTETEVAYLLGVAGTDVPIEDVEKVMKPQVLGLNAYAFIVTNNGYVLTHPDLRPVFQGILKPSYNSVDMTDLELMDDNSYAREFSPELLKLRHDIIMQKSDQMTLKVKYHFDGMRRAGTGKRYYFYRPIKDTPFTLVLVLPNQMELYRVSAQQEIRRLHVKANLQGNVLLGYFKGNNWRVHPDWTYCKYSFEDPFDTPEQEVLHFLNKTSQQGWYWPNKPFPPLPVDHHANSSATKSEKSDYEIMKKDLYFCDRTLLQSLVFDAIATKWFDTNVTAFVDENRQDFIKRFGLVTVFVATRSGLTRWQDFPASTDENNKSYIHNDGPPFGDKYNRAIDEVWYKRAVDQHYVNNESFVYAVPFDAEGDDLEKKSNLLVTATYAVFHTDRRKSAPAAVVGLQFRHSALHNFFLNITSTCNQCKLTCASPDVHCYVLDNNAYIIISEDIKDTGKFFGEVHGEIMERMVEENIFKRIHIYDYQAVCFRIKSCGEGSASSRLLTPLHYFSWVVNWVMGNIVWFLLQTNIQWLGIYATNYGSDDMQEYPEHDQECEETAAEANHKQGPLYASAIINRTRPQPCDMEMDLYQVIPDSKWMPKYSYQPDASSCKRPFKTKSIRNTNMMLVVINGLCKLNDDTKLSVHPTEVRLNATFNCTERDCEIHKLACFKLHHSNLSRKRPSTCIKYHPGEVNITNLCGNATTIRPYIWFTIFITFLRWCL
ncbi:voltage-dependent calcium channel subunit straightjacket isoform X2 [Lycorma delicatula]|uniref:voltage-dependent calcium channel subunit straightjacket isoform X2 n=1 Tax=Lycorma delicatula TaxID=130591 RepID=UPI003F516CAE